MKNPVCFLIIALLAGAGGVLFKGVAHSAADNQEINKLLPAEGMTSGQVRKIDKETGKLTIKHQRIANLNMPPMTMVFRVKEKNMLNAVQVGDTILFKAVDKNGVLTITEIK
jgi:Cu(I)/Ag(I) efflux system periplasmic protein CusF